MYQVGQAKANAELVADWLRSNPAKPGSSILFAGAGTGQMFDFISPKILSPYRVTFTDINCEYLRCLESRVKPKAQFQFEILVDDIERSPLRPEFALVVAALVLEHVDWRLAVATLCRLGLDNVFVVIQENPPGSPNAVIENQPLVGTMRIFREVHPNLVNRRELTEEFDHHHFSIIQSSEKEVLYKKKMVGLGFKKGHLKRTGSQENVPRPLD